jgi:hypothetical protein
MTPTLLAPVNSVTVIRGSSKTFQLTVVDQLGKPVDLTGAALFFTVKEKLEDPYPLIQKKSSDPTQILITNPKGGVAQIYLLPQDTANREPKDHVFDCWISLVSGKRYPVIPPSTFEVVAGVTAIP